MTEAFNKAQHGYKTKRGTWICKHCSNHKAENPGKQISCAFDRYEHKFNSSHWDCHTMLRLKGSMRTIGKRSLEDEERDSKTTTWHGKLSDGTLVMAGWPKSCGRGFMTFAVEGEDWDGLGPMTVETAYDIIEAAGKDLETAIYGESEEEPEDGEDDE